MDSDFLCRFLLWSLAFNYAVLLAWFLAFVTARDALRRLHGRWFALPDASFDALHYGGMAAYKIGILLFNLAPLAALWLARRGG
ncbi:MAG: DUF6868 family protein [Stenotrophomonas acidaminiphila]|jgi:NO-binding membrane sensor protein with MHYT domain|uniref:DUF6868 family protein n=1 Tax=Stenotrophomonas acidaminiphila TaxID=128780 RepID=UPI0028AE3E99|nr:hypothetical protein [Stenotrophomonas acidaminiphila]